MNSLKYRTISRRKVLQGSAVVAVSAALIAPFDVARAKVARVESADSTVLAVAQATANKEVGPRSVPAKVIPVPRDLDPATAALVGAPYSQLWNLSAPDAAGWQKIIEQSDSATVPMLAQARAALGVTLEPTTVGDIKAFILTPKKLPEAHKNQLIVSIHGGGFVFGHGEAGTQEAMLLAAIGRYKVISLDYQMPPEAPFPVGLDDIAAAWRALVETTDPRSIAVEGTSSGGNLTLALMLRAKREDLPLSAATAPGSPPSDLTLQGDSWKTSEWLDNVLVSGNASYLSQVGRLYTGDQDPRNPLISPLYGDVRGLPPAILTTGTRDLILSDTVRVHRKLRQAGVETDLQVYEGLSHAQYLFDPTLMVAKEVFGEMTHFFDAHLAV